MILGLHERHGARLDLDVVRERLMPVEVTRCHVEHHANVRPRGRDRLELKATELQHHPIVRAELVDAVEHRLADVAAPHHPQAAGTEHLRRERRGRRLAVGAGDPGDVGRAGAKEEVDLAGDLDAAPARCLDQGFVPGHAGAHHQEVPAVEVLCAIAAQPAGDPGPVEVRPQLRRIGAVDNADRSATTRNEGCGRPAAAAVAEDERVPPFHGQAEAPGRASASTSTAATSEPAQNHSARGVSPHPETMKWLCSGDILMIRLPVILKLATCAITETVSMTKTSASSGRYQRKPAAIAAAAMAGPHARLPGTPLKMRARERM